MTTMLMNCFSDIIIKRFNVNRDPRDQIKTRVVYAPKQRVLNDLLDKDQNLQLPVISVQIGGIARDENRVFNKLLGTFHHPANTTYSLNEKGPQPIDVTYNLSIMTRYQQDMDQILSHLLPYINPYFVVSWRTPQRPNFEIRSNVVWNGQANVQYPVELNANQVARVVADLSFVFKGWLFQNQTKHENIFNFNVNYIPLSTGANINDIDNLFLPNLYIENQFLKEAPPQPQIITPYYTNKNVIQQFTLWGNGFNNITNVYLSGSPISNSTIQNPFSSFSTLSASFPSFYGFKLPLTDWWSNDNGTLSLSVSTSSVSGLFDVILENPGGYGSLTNHVIINNYNPFPAGTTEHNSFVPYQLPFRFGVAVY